MSLSTECGRTVLCGGYLQFTGLFALCPHGMGLGFSAAEPEFPCVAGNLPAPDEGSSS